MPGLGTAALAASLCVFGVFLTNVVAGAFWRTQFIGDVGEMLILLLACTLFVVAILGFERRGGSDLED